MAALLPLAFSRGYVLTSYGDVVQCFLLLSVFIACARNVKASKRQSRFFWLLMLSGFGLWLFSQLLWTYFEVFLHREVPNPFVGDVFLFLHLVPIMAALATQPFAKRVSRVGELGAIDFVLLLVWWLYLYCFVVIPWQYIHPSEGLYGRSFDLVYFVEHAVLLSVAGYIWHRSTGHWRIIYGRVLAASILYALGSVAASLAIDFNRYYTGSLYDIPLNSAMACFFGMAVLASRLSFSSETADVEPRKRAQWIEWLATITILSLPIFAAWTQFVSHAPLEVRNFRTLLTLAIMMVMGGLLAVKQHRLSKHLAAANEELEEASLTDLLTGVRNRRFLATTIESDIRQVVRSFTAAPGAHTPSNRDVIFYFIDVDHFKEVNDFYGHAAGDQVLVEIARRISSAIRHSDFLVRWGGEEFLVMSRCTNRNGAEILASRILHAIGKDEFGPFDGQRLRRTCSIGWAVFPWFVGEPEAVHYEKVLQLADSALYQAKNDGRNKAIGILPATVSSPLPGTFEYDNGTLPARKIVTLGPGYEPETLEKNPAGPDLTPSALAAAASQDA
ncbi:MAG: GGDEF domain-containing protein [Acidobacteriales bacterium]|nr:GGDEF domain-containing protein [Terriglobales bacterium]